MVSIVESVVRKVKRVRLKQSGRDSSLPEKLVTHSDQTSTIVATSSLISNITETRRRREDLLRAEVALTNRCHAICRRVARQKSPPKKKEATEAFLKRNKKEANKLYKDMPIAVLALCQPFLIARGVIEEQRKEPEKRLKELAKRLPYYAWVKAQHGLGELSYAQIIAESGDLRNYSHPAKLWKRMGMATIDGKAQRRVRGEGAIEQGFNPHRRSLMYVVGDTLIRANGEWKAFYDRRKAYEIEQGKKAPHSKAKRYMEKRLLRELWRVWNGQKPEALV